MEFTQDVLSQRVGKHFLHFWESSVYILFSLLVKDNKTKPVRSLPSFMLVQPLEMAAVKQWCGWPESHLYSLHRSLQCVPGEQWIVQTAPWTGRERLWELGESHGAEPTWEPWPPGADVAWCWGQSAASVWSLDYSYQLVDTNFCSIKLQRELARHECGEAFSSFPARTLSLSAQGAL